MVVGCIGVGCGVWFEVGGVVEVVFCVGFDDCWILVVFVDIYFNFIFVLLCVDVVVVVQCLDV